MQFLINYIHAGKSYGIAIEAEDERDAGRRLRSIGMTGQVLGELVDSIEVDQPAPSSSWRIRWHMLLAALGPLRAV